jgi:hypothetical protein
MMRLTVPLLALLVAAPAAAQLEAALDIGYGHDHVWRGITRVSRPTFQPAASLAWKAPRLMVSAGGWALLEPWSPRADDLTLAGRDATLAEIDAWAQADYRLQFFSATIDATAGWIGYMFHGSGERGGVTDDWNTSEIYLGLRLVGLRELYAVIGLPPELPLGLETSVAFDLGPVGGTHLTTGLVAELPVFFVGDPLGAATFRLWSGWSWNQQPSAGEPGYFAGAGITHVALSAGLTPFFRFGTIPATVHLAGTVQYGIDEATRRRGLGPDDMSRVRGFIDVTFSVLFPLRSAP